MFTKEQLIEKGIEEDVAEKILSSINALLKEELNNNYVSKESFNSVNKKKNELQIETSDLTAEIERLKKLDKTNETLNTKLTSLENDYKALQEKYDNQAIVLSNENTVKNILANDVIDLDDVFPKIDMSKITFKDGKVVAGLEEQVNAIKEAKPHYFKTNTTNNPNNNIIANNISRQPTNNQQNTNQFFGFSPNNSNSNINNTDTSDVLFAKALAGEVIKTSDSLKKAEDVYFKGGIS